MELVTFHNSEYKRLYNCTGFNADAVPFEQRQKLALGLTFVAIGIVEFLLYIPCLAAIWRHREHSAYKIMFYIGCVDLGGIGVAGIASGVLGAVGATFCTTPTFEYATGVLATTFWVCESAADVLLALDRLLEMCAPTLAHALFGGWRAWFWLLVGPTALGAWASCSWRVMLFNSIYFSFYSNPFAGYPVAAADDAAYNDWSVLVALCSIYLCFGVALLVMPWRSGGQRFGDVSAAQRVAFVQIALIALLNSGTSFIYIYMETGFVVPGWLIVVAQLFWFQVHGIPPLIYLTLNKTLRDDVRAIVRKLFSLSDRSKTRKIARSTAALTLASLKHPAAVLVMVNNNNNNNSNKVSDGGGEEAARHQQQPPYHCSTSAMHSVRLQSL